MFTTSIKYDGTINGAMGLAGADAACASLASAAGLPAGTYKAWLSTSTVDAKSRLGTARGFIRPDGSPFADKVSDITAGKILNPPNIDENGAAIGDEGAWTGTNASGAEAAGETCSDWTSNSGLAVAGSVGGGPQVWTASTGAETSCSGMFHLYCFDTTHTNPLSFTPASGRIAFLSTGFDTSSGLSGADAQCQSEAASAGLPNPTTYLALLAISSASAESRFDLSAGSMPYVRPDGIKIADAPTIAAGMPLDSGIWQHADGSYETNPNLELFWAGADGVSSTDHNASETCSDWSTNIAPATGNLSLLIAGQGWWDGFSTFCSELGVGVLCLEQ